MEWQYNYYPPELYHYGIFGQKWGVRRFQNPDGTLTEAGKKRYNISSTGELVEKTRKEKRDYVKKEKARKEAEKRRNRLERQNETNEKKKARLLKSKDLEEILKNRDLFSNSELQDVLNRANIERNFENLVKQKQRDQAEQIKAGKKYLSDAVNNLSKGMNSVSNFIESGGKMYNSFAKVLNTGLEEDERLPLIGETKKSAQEKETDKNKKKSAYYKSKLDLYNYETKWNNLEKEKQKKAIEDATYITGKYSGRSINSATGERSAKTHNVTYKRKPPKVSSNFFRSRKKDINNR